MVAIVAGRSCQGCTLCCKLLGIAELEKPRGIWCSHCDPRRGCQIYGSHPNECRGFYCGFLTNGALSEIWRPTKCKMVLAYDETHAPRLSVHVDPDRANVWREEPYFSQITAGEGCRGHARPGDRVAWAQGVRRPARS